MSAPTPDRAALAERLRKIVRDIEGHHGMLYNGASPVTCREWGAVMADAAAALDAPAPEHDDSVPGPLDLAYQRGVAAARAHRRKATGRAHCNDPAPLPPWAVDAREAVLMVLQGEFPHWRDVERVDALLAAARAAALAEAVRVVEEREAESPDALYSRAMSDALDALRALGGAP